MRIVSIEEAKRSFVVVRERGPAWDAALTLREQRGWAEHAHFMDALVDEGFVVQGGPVGEGQRVLLIVAATDEDQIRARLAADPWSPHLLELVSVEPWTILLGADGPRG